MNRNDGKLSKGMKEVLAEDHLLKHAMEMSDKQAFNETMKIPKPKDIPAREKLSVIGYNRNVITKDPVNIEGDE